MLILASQSQTRKALLTQAGLRFETRPAPIDERALERQALEAGADGRDIALLLAGEKALVVSAAQPDSIVIGADQTLALGPTLLHKPENLEAARSQLDLLSGKTHRLHAGVALARNGKLVWSDIATAELTMRAFTPPERDAILAREGEEVLSSVGAYRLEGPSIQLFEAVQGDYFTILGLPLLSLLAALRLFAPETLS